GCSRWAAAAPSAVSRGAVAVVAEIVGKHVVAGVGQVLVLDHEVDLGIVEVAPRLAEVPWVPGAAHGQGVVEDHQLVAFAALGRDVPGFEGGAVVGRDDEVVPSLHSVFIRSLEEEATWAFNDTGEGLNLRVVLLGDGLLLLQSLPHSFVGNPAHGVSPFVRPEKSGRVVIRLSAAVPSEEGLRS